jgi:outer membrane lipoprotein-sorting protein
MKKIFIYALLILATTQAFAQKDAQAKVILNQLSQKYRSFATIKSDFTFTMDNPQEGIKQTQTGTLIAQSKTNKYKISLYSAGANPVVEQEIISDGKKQWTYLKKDKEVQLSKANNSSDGFNPAQLFTIYEKGYKYLYTGDQKTSGKIYQVIELTPENTKQQFFKIRLLIDKAKKQLYNALIFDKNGTKYNYTIRSFVNSPQVPDNTFAFDVKAHPGVELVDLQ